MDCGTQAMGGRGLGHNRANEVVSQDVHPDLLHDQLRRLATQFMHMQVAFDRAQIELIFPTRAIESRQVLWDRLLVIEQRRHDHDVFVRKPS